MTEFITERISELLVENYGGEEITRTSQINECTNFVTDIGMSSLDLLDFIIMCDSEFSINIRQAELGSIKTVGDMVTIVHKYMGESKAGV